MTPSSPLLILILPPIHNAVMKKGKKSDLDPIRTSYYEVLLRKEKKNQD